MVLPHLSSLLTFARGSNVPSGLDHDWSTREAWLENPPPSAPGASLVVHQQPKCGKRLMYIRERNPLGSYPCATLSDCFR